MKESKRDRFGVATVLALDQNDNIIALRANSDGSLAVSMAGESPVEEGRKLKEVIKLNLGKSRDKVLFDQSFNEITVPVIEGSFTFYIDEPIESKGLTINRALSIETKANKFYISNGSGKGQAEIWIWE